MATTKQTNYIEKLIGMIDRAPVGCCGIDSDVADRWPWLLSEWPALTNRIAVLSVQDASRLIDALRPEAQSAFVALHPEKFQGQIWESCRCGHEPVNMPSHLCTRCLMRTEDHPRLSTSSEPEFYMEPDGAR